MAASAKDSLVQQITTTIQKRPRLNFEGVRLFAISDYLLSDEFKVLQEQVFNFVNNAKNFEDNTVEEVAPNQPPYAMEQQQKQVQQSAPRPNTTNKNRLDDISPKTREMFNEQDNKYICKICGKELRKTNSLEDHIRLHTGETPYKCKECGKSFSQAVSLNLHMRVHAAPSMENKCSVCLITFENQDKLIDHMRVHSALKRFPCPVCSKNFSSSSKLRRHLPTHTGEKRYNCAMCSKKFSQSSSLNKHIKTVHNDNTYESVLG